MSKRLTYKFVKEQFEKEGWKLLSTEYKNNHTKLEVICNNNHKHYISWKRFRRGERCPECSGNRKKTIEEIKEYAKKYNWKCLSDKYRGKDRHLLFECPIGHIRKISWNAFRNGRRCAICSKKKKKTIKEVKKYAKYFGFECLSNEYINAMSLLIFKCPNNHTFKMSASAFINGNQRCAECSGVKQKTLKEIKNATKELTSNNINCISKKYKNNKQILLYICNKNHKFYRSWNQFIKNQKCPKCEELKILDKFNDFQLYSYITKRLTEKNYKKYRDIITNDYNKKRNKKYHLDHIYSISNGFLDGILPIIISNPINLRIIDAKSNISKWANSDMSKKDLYIKFDEFNNKKLGVV